MQNSGSSSHGFTHKLFKFQYKRVLVSPTGSNLLCSSLFLNAKLSSNEEMRTILIFVMYLQMLVAPALSLCRICQIVAGHGVKYLMLFASHPSCS
jgi:hypothetical protein